MNERCPIVLSQFHSITSVELDEDTIVYKVLTTEELTSMEVLKKKTDMQRKYVLMTMTQQDSYQQKELLSIANDKLWLKTCFIGQKSEESVSLLYSPEEIKNAINNPKSKTEVSEMMIKMSVEEAKTVLPMEIEKGITWTETESTPSSLIHIYKVDENYYDISAIKTNEKSIKDSMLPALVADKAMLKALVETKRELHYKYVGNKSGRSAIMKYSVEELKDLIRTN